MGTTVDNRIVVLLKSLRTNNRFYTLVAPDRGLRNADAIADFPEDLILGIAYPCLEDGLNDFAVIRTTFETIDLFPDDYELRGEMMTIIKDARSNLIRRLEELRDKILSGEAHFLGTDLNEFKGTLLHMVHRGTPRRQLDNMMKVDVFESVAQSDRETAGGGDANDPMFRYQFRPGREQASMEACEPRKFVGELLQDVLESVLDDGNYAGKHPFDREVFQRFIAVMFVNYATTDQKFHGTSREDYGVSSDKDMQETPLYQAIAEAVRDIERGREFRRPEEGVARPGDQEAEAAEELARLFQPMESEEEFLRSLQEAGETGRQVQIPFGTEGQILEKLTLLADAARVVHHLDLPHATEVRQMMTGAGQQLFRMLQELEIVSSLAIDPFADLRLLE